MTENMGSRHCLTFGTVLSYLGKYKHILKSHGAKCHNFLIAPPGIWVMKTGPNGPGQMANIQSNFSGSNTFGTMKISSRQG